LLKLPALANVGSPGEDRCEEHHSNFAGEKPMSLHPRLLNLFLAGTGLLVWPSSQVLAQQVDNAIEAIRNVGPKGKGNPAAASAWRDLVAKGAEGMIPALEAMDDDSPLSGNWFRSALDAMTDKARQQSQALPLARVEAFVLDRKKGRAARAIALEMLESSDSALAGRILDVGQDDPSGEIRRKAISRAMANASKLSKEDQIGMLEKLFGNAADIDQVEKIARDLKALGKEMDVRDRIGYIAHWSVIGPFDNKGNQGFVQKTALEKAAIDLARPVPGPQGELNWKEHVTTDKAGVVDLNKVVGNEKSVVAYAFTRVQSPSAQRVQLRVGSITSIRVYLNGAQVYEHDEYHHGMNPDQYIAELELQPGVNSLLIKVGQNDKAQSWEKNWQFQARLTDFAGARANIRPIGPR
jgi:hypothetical protein